MGWLVNNAMNWRKQNRNKHYNTNNYMAINATKKRKKKRGNCYPQTTTWPDALK